MHALVLSSHLGRRVTVEHCADCRLIWFDALESVSLDARGWLALLREMQTASARPPRPAIAPALACPHCHQALKTVSNQTRFGRFVALECPQRHGHLHSHAGVLAERGLVRPLQAPERKALQERRQAITCFGCGAPADGDKEHCGFCQAPLVVLDLPRLAHSLKPRRLAEERTPVVAGRALAWACRACGSPLDPARDVVCGACGHLVVATGLPDLTPLLDAAEALLDNPPPPPPPPPSPPPPGRDRWDAPWGSDGRHDRHEGLPPLLYVLTRWLPRWLRTLIDLLLHLRR